MTTVAISLDSYQPPFFNTIIPLRVDWDLLFQPMFDESLSPPPNVDLQAPEVIAPIPEGVAPEHAVSTGSSSSTTVDQDAPSPRYPLENIIGALDRPVSTRLQLHEQALFCYYDAFLTSVEPKNYKEALTQACWIEAMQEELHEFERLKVRELVPPPDKAFVISLKWIYKFKLDELGDGSLNGKMREDVNVSTRRLCGIQTNLTSLQSLKKSFGLKTSSRARNVCCLNSDIIMTSQRLSADLLSCSSVEKATNLLLISQSPRGIFINQSKYALESLKKYGYESCDPVDTPMVEKSKLDEDKDGKAVDPSHYRGMIGTLLYLTASRPDLQFAICMCARYQARPTEKHLNAVKRIFRYLKGTVHRGLWYPKDSSFALTAFADADHAGCQDTRRSTSGSIQLLGDRLVSWSSKSRKALRSSSTEVEYIAFAIALAATTFKFQIHAYRHQVLTFKEHVENGVIELYFVNTEYQLADIFTKALGRERIEFLINKLGMRSFTPETLKQLADEVDE
ncbi:hypothetical protein Tco_1203200 [Tanacetum coccineum]